MELFFFGNWAIVRTNTKLPLPHRILYQARQKQYVMLYETIWSRISKFSCYKIRKQRSWLNWKRKFYLIKISLFSDTVFNTMTCFWPKSGRRAFVFEKWKKARNLKSEKSFPAWHIEHSKPSHAMRQQNKTETEKENRSPWTRQYSDDVFIEDPLPAIKPRWEFNLIKNKFLKILCFSAFEWFSGLWMFKCRSRTDVGWVGGTTGDR